MAPNFDEYTNLINDMSCYVDNNTSKILRGMALESAAKVEISTGAKDNWGYRFSDPYERYLSKQVFDFQINDDTYECVQQMPKHNPLCPFKLKIEAIIGFNFWRGQMVSDACKAMIARLNEEVQAETKILTRFQKVLCSGEHVRSF